MDIASYRNESAVDKRNSTYVFSSMSDLKKYFSGFFSKKEIQEVINDSKKAFIVRDGISEDETQLQFINKCEVELLKQVRSDTDR